MDSVISARNVAAEVVEEFERVLDKHNIYIPSEDRKGDDGEACLYGCEYSDVLDAVEEIIFSALNTAQNRPNAKIIKGVFY